MAERVNRRLPPRPRAHMVEGEDRLPQAVPPAPNVQNKEIKCNKKLNTSGELHLPLRFPRQNMCVHRLLGEPRELPHAMHAKALPNLLS